MKPTDKEFDDAMRSYEQYKKNRAFKALFQRSSWAWDVRELNWRLQVICWIKTFICLMLDRTGGSYLNSGTLCVLAYDERSCYDSQSWDAVWVSPYLFKDWQICLAIDGT